MKLPVIRGVIERRILVNYRIDAAILTELLPSPFRPKVIHGVGMAGICLIRLKSVRPRFVPTLIGISSENAAHRIAVEWDDHGTIREGVYVQRRDTNSWFNSWTGGRIFPGYHHHARFTVSERDDSYHVSVRSDDGVTSVEVQARRNDRIPTTSVFGSLSEASAFFEAGSLGYSPAAVPASFQGLELRCRQWQVEPLEVAHVRSSVFDDPTLFPKGSIEFDCALLMLGIEHEWHCQSDLCCVATGPRPGPRQIAVTQARQTRARRISQSLSRQ